MKSPLSESFRRAVIACGFLAVCLGAAAAQAPRPAAPADPAKVVARVNGIDITEGELALAEEDIGQNIRADGEARRQQLIQYLADLKAGAKLARERKVEESAEFKRRQAYVWDKVLLDELLAQEVKKAISPEAMRKLYDETVKNLQPEMEVRARHILVETEDEAKKIVERLNKGEDFAKLAKELSKDPGSGKEGGDLGYFTKERMVKEFAAVAFSIEKGKISAPVKSQFGWHVIRVEDSRVKPLPEFESVRPQIERFLSQKAQQDFIMAQRAANKVERLDKPEEKKP
jgi:peptidyl-prolyl cis-trans isomerase C